MQRLSVRALLAPAILIAAFSSAACSEVLIDPQGTGGRSGGDGGGSSAADGTSSGFDPTLCGAFCDAVESCIPSCSASCQGYLHAPCESQGAALVACLTEGYDVATCSAPACEAEMQALVACRSNGTEHCSGGGCSSTDTDSGCSTACEGGQRQVLCVNDGGVASCVCYLSSIFIGECTGAWSGDPIVVCSVGSSCCADLFGDCDGCF